jgi:uncharacterized protein YbbK (DUF523 family)
MDEGIKLGISACLLGKNVRYDGGHKRDRYLIDALDGYVEFVPVCPEEECGFGTPREPLRLIGDPHAPRLITAETQKDYTKMMSDWARQRIGELEGESLRAFIFKSHSPSCGMRRVDVYIDDSAPIKKGVGIFARAFMNRFPRMRVEEDRHLADPKLRDGFIAEILA